MDPYDQYADEIVGRAWRAGERFHSFDQAQTDRIVRAVYEAAYDARLELARLAHQETGIGLYEHKVLKNAWASLLIYDDIRERRTVGVLSRDPATGITEIAQPKGTVLAMVPVTNPTSTTIFKILICMKTRNPVIFSPHRAARECVRRTVEILGEAACRAGAPPDSIQSIARAETEYLERVMRHRRLALILATGTGEIVRRAQESGTPTLGVGPGNVPVYIHSSADLPLAARTIVHSKTFDNGTVCASEQALVVEPEVDEKIRPLLEARGAWFCTPEQALSLGQVCYDTRRRSMRPEVVGRPVEEIAGRAGFRVPIGIRLLIAEPGGIGADHPLSYEILAPVLAYYRVPDYASAIATCRALNHLGGIGHTIGLYANDEGVVADFGTMNAGRIVVNTPSTEGAIGGVFNSLKPSLTLACGTGAGNLSTDNITIDHLINVHRVAKPVLNRRWLDISRETWLDPAVGHGEILEIYNRKR